LIDPMLLLHMANRSGSGIIAIYIAYRFSWIWLLFVIDLTELILQIGSYVFDLITMQPNKRFRTLS
jgi:hypothetical protein